MKKILFLILFLFFSLESLGQITKPAPLFKGDKTTAVGDAQACVSTIGTWYYDTTLKVFKWCKADNTWSALGGAAIGGTVTGATEGSVFFAGASGVLAQDNANLSWNNTNKRLMLSSGAPTGVQFGTLSGTYGGRLYRDGSYIYAGMPDGGGFSILNSTGSSTFFHSTAYGRTAIGIDNGSQSTDAQLFIYASTSSSAAQENRLRAATQVGQKIQLAASQTADAFQVLPSGSSTPLFSVNKDGNPLLRDGGAYKFTSTVGFSFNSLNGYAALDGANFAINAGNPALQLISTNDIAQRARIIANTAGVVTIDNGTTTGATIAPYPSTPAQITADAHNYNPAGRGYVQRWSSDAARTVTGLVFSGAAALVAGEQHLIVNVGSNNIVLAHESASSTAANRFLTSTGADITLSANQAADLVYDNTTQRWRVFKKN